MRSSWLRESRVFCCGRQDRLFLFLTVGTVIASADELLLGVLLLICHNKIINKDIKYNTIHVLIINIIISPLYAVASLIEIICTPISGAAERGDLR